MFSPNLFNMFEKYFCKIRFEKFQLKGTFEYLKSFRAYD